MIVRAVVGPLEGCPETLDAVGRYVVADALFLRVVDTEVAETAPMNAFVAGVLVGVNGRASGDVLVNQLEEDSLINTVDDFGNRPAAPALLHADNRNLADGFVTLLALVLVSFLAAEVRLVYFNRVLRLSSQAAGFPDTMTHVPGRFLGDAESVGQLDAAHTLL